MTDPILKPRILVVFYSMTGNVAALAQAVAEGAAETQADVRVVRVHELMPASVFEKKPDLKEIRDELREFPEATSEDLVWADGVAFGSPTRFGNMSAQLKQFIDSQGSLWMSGALTGKLAAVFSSTGTQHGGQEATLLSMMVPLFHFGFLMQGLPYAEAAQTSMKEIHGGSPYGVTSVSGPDSKRGPTAADIEMARGLGRRLAQNAALLRRNQILERTKEGLPPAEEVA